MSISYSAPHPSARNYRRRCELRDMCNAIKARWTAALDAYDASETEDEDAAIVAELERLSAEMQDLRKAEAALLLPESRNEWFRAFASSFPTAASAPISAKQADIFERYGEKIAVERNTIKYQARNSGRLFTVIRSGKRAYLTVENLKYN